MILGTQTFVPNSPTEDKGVSNKGLDNMVYSSKFVMCVLKDGVPAKELANGVVKIPFGSSYALRFRNKNNRRALVKFFIDGEEASGSGYIVSANGSVDIERWAEKAVKFNFVALDSPEAIDFGKNGPNEDKVNGTIEARFFLEKEYPVPAYTSSTEVHHHHHYPKPTPWYMPNPFWHVNGGNRVFLDLNDQHHGPSVTCTGVAPTCDTYSSNSVKPPTSSYKGMMSRPNIRGSAKEQEIDDLKMNIIVNNPCVIGMALNDAPPIQDGCTVEGSHSSQTFRIIQFEAETDYVVVKVFLQGYQEAENMTAAKESTKTTETEEDRYIREILAENARLLEELENKRVRGEKNLVLRKLEEENRKLREKLGI